jgi:hypothetical protein
VGCSAPVVDDPIGATGGITQGIILVERATTAEGAPQTNVSAKFMRLSGTADPETAERVVGTRLDLPAVGECALVPAVGNEDMSAALSALGAIELLDVGDLTMKTGDAVMPLAARAFPDVGGVVSGVFYTSRDATSDLPAPAKYVLEGSGSAMVDRFAIESDAPSIPEDVRVGGTALSEGISLDTGSAAIVRWRSEDPQRARQGAEDLVYVDVTAATGAAIRCAFSDEGRGVIPASMLRTGFVGALPAAATLGIHRVRLSTFIGPGIDLGEIRFDLSVLGRATISAD